ncbi:uncharacterized protein LOC110817326 [Carica papaya]|uniref:uncharacterized protein LOC110817326 n=1 Tax=Carica papaya TaxID=3649 RepID=UPI000B8CF19A|nr:uncharacterized protein LOC110817326 [Carica papaya]
MGSLMAGWDSPVVDSKSVRYKRNQSCTKEEIKAFWLSKKKAEKEHLKAVSLQTEHEGLNLQRSNSVPVKKSIEGYKDSDGEANLQKRNAWWRSSKWAFLNQPPVIKGF